jgi:hypothetical protein
MTHNAELNQKFTHHMAIFNGVNSTMSQVVKVNPSCYGIASWRHSIDGERSCLHWQNGLP